MNKLFDNPEDVSDNDSKLSGSALKREVAEMADRLSARINRMAVSGNRVSFTLNRETALHVRDLAQLEGLSLSQMCERLVSESVAD